MWGGGNVFSEKMKAENICKCLQGYRGPDTQTLYFKPPLPDTSCSWQSTKARLVLQVPYQPLSAFPKSSVYTGSGQLRIVSSNSQCWSWSYTLYLQTALDFPTFHPSAVQGL